MTEAAAPDPPDTFRAALAAMNAAEDDRRRAAYRRRLATAPGWWFDREFVNSIALEFLPVVAADLGFTTVCAAWVPGEVAWWPEGEPGHILMLADARHRAVFVDRASGYWIADGMTRRGTDLVGFAAYRLGVSDAKAAWRLAKLCALRRPHA